MCPDTCFFPVRRSRQAGQINRLNPDLPMLTATFAAYFVLVFVIGWFAYRHTHNLSDYVLGGRRLGRWTTAISAGASDMSGWLLLGLPGYAYLAGFEAVWIVTGLLLGTTLNWIIVAPRLRVYSESCGNALTLSEFFEYRLNDGSHLLRYVSAFFILLFFLFYTASGLVAGGKLFETVFGLSYYWAVCIGAAAILVYTSAGGFLAVSWTDLIQGLLMLLALSLVAITAIHQIGGWDAMVAGINKVNPALNNIFLQTNGAALPAIGLVSLLGWGLGYFGQPHILARFMAIRSPGLIKDARRIAVAWSALSLTAALLIGVSAITYLPQALTGADSEKIFIEMVQRLFHPVPAGVCLAAILAAIMSTADSQLLVASSVVTEDFYKTFFKQSATDSELVYCGRAAVILISLIALLLAMDPERKVLDLVSYAWAGFGATFGPVLILALYWKKLTVPGTIAGIAMGGGTVIIWARLEGGIYDLYELVPGFMMSLVAAWLTSLLSQAYKKPSY